MKFNSKKILLVFALMVPMTHLRADAENKKKENRVVQFIKGHGAKVVAGLGVIVGALLCYSLLPKKTSQTTESSDEETVVKKKKSEQSDMTSSIEQESLRDQLGWRQAEEFDACKRQQKISVGSKLYNQLYLILAKEHLEKAEKPMPVPMPQYQALQRAVKNTEGAEQFRRLIGVILSDSVMAGVVMEGCNSYVKTALEKEGLSLVDPKLVL